MWNMQLGATLEVSVWDSSGSKGVVTTPNPGATWRQISLLLSNPRFCLDYFLLPADHVSALLNFLALGKAKFCPVKLLMELRECCSCGLGWCCPARCIPQLPGGV